MRRFSGGVHPHDEKICSDKKIESIALPSKVIIPLQQHIGAPAQPLVKVGDVVKKGQKIGEGSGFVSSNIHASISGKVVEIANHLYPNPAGRTALSVIIESDGNNQWYEGIKPPDNSDFLDSKGILNLIKESGIVGMGGATFPTHVKLSVPDGKKIDSVILNGVECEPYISSDHRLMVEEPEKVIDGLKLIMKVLKVENGFIGIEKNKPDAIEVMKKITANTANIKVIPLKVKYPQGWENMLIKSILNRKVPPGSLPLDVGVLVSNVGTATAISNAIRLGKPMIERIVGLTGPGISQPKNLRVPIGTLFSDLIQQCGGFKGNPVKIIAGGPMMGFALFNSDVPVVKGTSNILVLTQEEAQTRQVCIRCGRCIRVCPVGLMPTTIAGLTEKGKIDAAEAYFPMDCKECGCCGYVCPAKIPLVQLIQFAKANIVAKQRAKAK